MGQTTISAREAEIRDHAAKDGDLGRVFLAEEGEVRLGGDEQLGDDGGDAAKMAGAGCAVEAIAEAGDLDESGVGAVGVKFFDRGREENIGAFGFGERAVGLEAAGIAGIVLVGAELRGVDEEAHGDLRHAVPPQSNQRRVAGVERAHGGHQTDALLAPLASA